MAGKKILFLFLALLLPVGVFLFLKTFGKNEFDVPVLYSAGVVDKPAGCNLDYGKPYFLPDSIFIKIDHARNASLTIIDFAKAHSSRLESIQTKFKGAKVVLKPASELSINSTAFSFVRQCILLLNEQETIILVDNEKRIRGKYNGTKRDELDRLEAEIIIILKKY
jgi:hypothetical protein